MNETVDWEDMWQAAFDTAKRTIRDKHKAEEIAQEVCLEASEKEIHQDADGKHYLTGPDGDTPLEGYVKQLAKLRAIDRSRTEKRRHKREEDHVCGGHAKVSKKGIARAHAHAHAHDPIDVSERRIKHHHEQHIRQEEEDDITQQCEVIEHEADRKLLCATIWGMLSGEYRPLIPIPRIADAMLGGQLKQFLDQLSPEECAALADAQNGKNQEQSAAGEGVDASTISCRLKEARKKFKEFFFKQPRLMSAELKREFDFCHRICADALRDKRPEMYPLIVAAFTLAYARRTRDPKLVMEVWRHNLGILPEAFKRRFGPGAKKSTGDARPVGTLLKALSKSPS